MDMFHGTSHTYRAIPVGYPSIDLTEPDRGRAERGLGERSLAPEDPEGHLFLRVRGIQTTIRKRDDYRIALKNTRKRVDNTFAGSWNGPDSTCRGRSFL